MDYFKKLNEKLDLGWKYTDCSCPTCSKQALFDPSTDTFQCIHCNKALDLQRVSEKEIDLTEQKPLDLKETPKPQKETLLKETPLKKEDPSKKLAQKLLEGWTMLEECCPDCFVPLMKPRKGGSAICVSCDYKWGGNKKENNNENSNKKNQNSFKDIPYKQDLQRDFNDLSIKETLLDKNHDKPRPLIKENQSKRARISVLNSQEEAIENISTMILALTGVYKEKINGIVNEKNLDSAERIIKGPLKTLVKIQGDLLQNYARLKEL